MHNITHNKILPDDEYFTIKSVIQNTKWIETLTKNIIGSSMWFYQISKYWLPSTKTNTVLNIVFENEDIRRFTTNQNLQHLNKMYYVLE